MPAYLAKSVNGKTSSWVIHAPSPYAFVGHQTWCDYVSRAEKVSMLKRIQATVRCKFFIQDEKVSPSVSY